MCYGSVWDMSFGSGSPMGEFRFQRTMNCPVCGELPKAAFGDTLFCGNMACNILSWDSTKTLDELLTDVGIFDLRHSTDAGETNSDGKGELYGTMDIKG